ncbi:MAG: hypothetical protein AAF916_04465 [Planctomycetota bacterium]
MDYLLMLLWLSPCWLPVAAVALLALLAVLRQAKQDALSPKNVKRDEHDAEAERPR